MKGCILYHNVREDLFLVVSLSHIIVISIIHIFLNLLSVSVYFCKNVYVCVWGREGGLSQFYQSQSPELTLKHIFSPGLRGRQGAQTASSC